MENRTDTSTGPTTTSATGTSPVADPSGHTPAAPATDAANIAGPATATGDTAAPTTGSRNTDAPTVGNPVPGAPPYAVGTAGPGASTWNEIPAASGAPAADPGRERFRLVRSRSDRMLGGVCGGLGRTLGVDPALLRIGMVVLTLLGAGAGVVVYVAAWILAPEED
jgi:phage shock protein PspC (stress-responsive transcriptional regulator)